MSDTTKTISGTLRGLQEGLKEWVALIAAVGFLLAFLVLNYLLFSQHLGEGAEPWSRAMMLYTSVEALALTAAGYLFGREVNRERAVNAEQQANQAQQQTVIAVQEAAQATATGHTIAVAVETLATKPRPENLQPEAVAADLTETVEQIRRVVRTIYP